MKATIIGMRNDLLKLSAVLILLAALAACAPAEVAPSATPIPSETPAPAASATNTPTLSPTASATRTPRPTGTLTPSPSPTPLAAFDQAKPIQLASGVGGWNLTFVVPNLNKAVNVIAAGIQFNCAYDERYPERLFCYGLSRPPLDQTITLAFLDTESGRVLYQSQTVFASAAFPTAVPVGNPETNCPQRGQNVTCETECRVDPSTNIPCIVSTCYDACGHYFSVDSCPGGVSVWNVCSDAQWQELKTRFNIP